MSVRETKWNADAFETLTLLDDEVHQRGMTVPGNDKTFVNQNGQLVIYPPCNCRCLLADNGLLYTL